MRKHRDSGYGLDLQALPKSKPEADAIGSSYFYPGKPCFHGHDSSRYASSGNCTYCSRERSAKKFGHEFSGASAKAVANKTRAAAHSAGVHTYIPESPCPHGHKLRWTSSTNCVECDKATQAKRKDLKQLARFKKLYGLSPTEHEALFDHQGRACLTCSDAFETRFQMHVDHCHSTGRVRGMLCQRCNQAIGLLREDSGIATRIAEYINGFAKTIPNRRD